MSKKELPDPVPIERRPVGDPTTEECGCKKQLMSDETMDIVPCPPHGLMEAAGKLSEAANAFACVATALHNMGVKARLDAAMVEANDAVDKGIEDGDIT